MSRPSAVTWVTPVMISVRSCIGMAIETDRQLLSALDGSYGVATRAELVRAGLSPSSIDRRLRSGVLEPIFPGVYRLATASRDRRSQLFAAWKWGGERAMVRGRCMAELIGLESFNNEPLQLYVFSGRSHPRIETKRVLDEAITGCRWWSGIRTTTIERLLFDLCSEVRPVRAGRAMDECLIRRWTTVDRLRQEVLTGTGRRGIKAFNDLLVHRDDQDDRVRSIMEIKMLRLLRGIPGGPVADYEVRFGSKRYFLDFAFPVARLAIECQSTRWHAGAEAIKSDSRRHRDLTLAGWTVLYYTWDDIRFRPQEVVREISDFIIPKLALS